VARINIESKLFIDARFKRLEKVLGEALAIGWLVILWRLAQEHYRKGDMIIPLKSYDFYKFPNELIECEFVVKTEEGYYVKGSKRNFEWIRSKTEAASKGGIKSAENRLKKYGSSIPFGAKNSKSCEASASNLPKCTEPSSSSSFSFSKNKNIYIAQIEEIYELYPRKEGKAKGIEKLLAQITSERDIDSFRSAVKKYNKLCQGKERNFIKHFSSFAECWQDYVDEEKEVIYQNEESLGYRALKMLEEQQRENDDYC
jgi:hypothetical protein